MCNLSKCYTDVLIYGKRCQETVSTRVFSYVKLKVTLAYRYNPVLGEIFRCRYDYADGTVGYYVAEQVSHHPPISAFYYCSPDNRIIIRGELRPKSRFLGNSAANIMDGVNKIAFIDKPEDGEYSISMPNMYARGILFGKVRRSGESETAVLLIWLLCTDATGVGRRMCDSQ